MMLVSERGRMARKLLMEHDGGKNIRMSLLFMISRILLAILTYGRCGTHTPEEGGAVDLFLTVSFVFTFACLVFIFPQGIQIKVENTPMST